MRQFVLAMAEAAAVVGRQTQKHSEHTEFRPKFPKVLGSSRCRQNTRSGAFGPAVCWCGLLHIKAARKARHSRFAVSGAPMQLLIDTDPGVDDAMALIMAFTHPAVTVRAVTVVGGNVGLAYTTLNALRMVELCDCEVPVYAGASAPLLHPARDAAFVHGEDGFGDVGSPVPSRVIQNEHAATAIIRYARMHPRQLTLVALGPLTNIALALKLEPRLPRMVERLVVMGGAVTGRGNTDIASAEFNIGFDPEAAFLVFQQWPQLTLVDWEATLAHAPSVDDVRAIFAKDTPRARFMKSISSKTEAFVRSKGSKTWAWADPLAMLAAISPGAVVERAQRGARVILDGPFTRGQTLVDWDQRMSWNKQVDIVQRFKPGALLASMASALEL